MNQIQLDRLEVGYGRRSIVENVTGEIESGEWIHCFGKNGTGKTSFLQTVASFNYPLSGQIQWNGSNIFDRKHDFRAQLRYFGHEVSLYERLTVRDNWSLFTGLFDIQSEPPQSLTENISPDSLVGELSRGQKRRLELSSMISAPRNVVVLDEPFASLDSEATDSLVTSLNEIRSNDGIVLTASPDASDHASSNWQISGRAVIKNP